MVIGAGSAGLVSAYIAAAVKSKVTLIERHKMGGDCLNTGCVPSKALIKSAKIAEQMRHADRYGITPTEPDIPFGQTIERVMQAIRTIEPHDSVERYTKLGVEVYRETANRGDGDIPYPATYTHTLPYRSRPATLRQLPYCDGQGAATRLGFEYECPDCAVDPSINDENNPADSCEAIQVRSDPRSRARHPIRVRPALPARASPPTRPGSPSIVDQIT